MGKQTKEILIQFALWAGIVYLFMVIVTMGEYFNSRLHHPEGIFPVLGKMVTAALLAAFMMMVYYYWLYCSFFARRRFVVYISLAICFSVIMVPVDALTFYDEFSRNYRETFSWALSIGLQRVMIAYTPMALFYSIARGNIVMRKRKDELEQEQLKNALLLLKEQVKPHFLFNTLNSIYATAHQEEAAKTAACIDELAQLFRYTIDQSDKETVAVYDELKFIEQYLHLQHLRIADVSSVAIDTHIQWDHVPAGIAPMLTLPYIENAFKYGVSYEQPSKVSIRIDITNGLLSFHCENTDHAQKDNRSEPGTGIANTKKRLDLQYAGRYQLEQGSANGIYTVSLKLSLS